MWFQRKARLGWLGAAVLPLATLIGFFVILGGSKEVLPSVTLSDGNSYTIEAVTYGTNHVVGRNSIWRQVLPGALSQFLPAGHSQSRATCSPPALIVWMYAREAKTGKSVDLRDLRVALSDEHGDEYPCQSWSSGGSPGRFIRGSYLFATFPRRPRQFTVRLFQRQQGPAGTVRVKNPVPPPIEAAWAPETLPAAHEVNGLQFILKRLILRTQGGSGEPRQQHWMPDVELKEGGRFAEGLIDWEAEDATGNRGQWLGLHEPVLKFAMRTWPKPETVHSAEARWQLPFVDPPAERVYAESKQAIGKSSVRVVGLFPPGVYTFCEGALTNAPAGATPDDNGGWRPWFFPGGNTPCWQFGRSTNYMAFVRFEPSLSKERLAAGLRDELGHVVWSQTNDEHDHIYPFVLELPPGFGRVALEVVVLTPVQTEFVVKPPRVE